MNTKYYIFDNNTLNNYQEREIEKLANELYIHVHPRETKDYKICHNCGKVRHITYFVKGCRQRKHMKIPPYNLIPNYCTACRAYMNKGRYNKKKKIII
jgi:hypothetical protein